MMRLRITRHGAVYTVMGVLLLISGLLRGELLSAVCGGLLTLYAGFAAAAVAITALCWKSEEPDFASDGGSFTVIPARFKTVQSESAKTFPHCVPGTAAFYTIEFSLSPEPITETFVTVSIPLQGIQTKYHPKNLPRGRYFYKRQYLNIRDFAGFFAAVYMQPPCLSVPYIVVQPVIPPQKTIFPDLRSRAVNDLPSQERTNELYESRPYFPGDDPRKIHWKLYAHTNTLSIKLGAFEPPPVKRLTIYIEEPVCMKKKEQAWVASVFDAFIGRLSGVIIELLNAGIQCSLLLYDYSQQSLQRYEITEEASTAASQIQNLLAIPALRASPEALPDAAAVFQAVPDGGGLLYCYVPSVNATQSVVGTPTLGIAASQNTAAYRKITAYSRSGVETFFCLAVPPVSEEHTPLDERAHRVLSRRGIHRLLYASAASARQDAFYRKVQEAAERELRIFTAGNCHAELL
ncbi:DUF58 domain-containing protein [Treponema sp. OMZ 855]|uniref:DUF58 domain-containing protein n=1 Tax=Treponema sp. OMZ 855 TaxID=1643512 RepID=UPI0020A613A6|nr:DUF58 domain-containing protein [Treponema sp. OMZ 855]UTC50779.1 DUF58 domain-containing protein [Treponema sp. OMZ 855]